MKDEHTILYQWVYVMIWVMIVVLLASAIRCYGDGPICQGSTPCSPAYSPSRPAQTANPRSRVTFGENSRPLASVSGYGVPGYVIYDPCSPFYKVLVSFPSHRSRIWQTMPPYCRSPVMSGCYSLFRHRPGGPVFRTDILVDCPGTEGPNEVEAY